MFSTDWQQGIMIIDKINTKNELFTVDAQVVKSPGITLGNNELMNVQRLVTGTSIDLLENFKVLHLNLTKGNLKKLRDTFLNGLKNMVQFILFIVRFCTQHNTILLVRKKSPVYENILHLFRPTCFTDEP